MMRTLSQGRSRLHYGVFVTPLVPTSAHGEVCVAPSQSGAIGELHSTLTAQRVVRAETVHEHGTPSPVSYIPGRQIGPTRHRH